MPLVIATDFDSVLHNPDERRKGYKMGVPIIGAKDAVHEMKWYGHEVIVFCYWASTPERVEAIKAWLDYFKIPWDEVTNIKPKADYYIDNNGIRFETWQQTLDFMKNRMEDRQ